jgi:hypothetical protein
MRIGEQYRAYAYLQIRDRPVQDFDRKEAAVGPVLEERKSGAVSIEISP